MSTVSFGRSAETAAAEYLVSRGLEILARNYAVRGSEIDIIAREGACIVFAEVKAAANTSDAHGAPRERVTPAKQRRFVATARAYLGQHPEHTGRMVRFDVVTVTGDGIEHLPNAFTGSEW